MQTAKASRKQSSLSGKESAQGQDWTHSLLHILGPIFPSGCEGKLGLALESLQGLRDLT